MKGNRLWLLATIASIAVIVVLGWLLGISPRLAEADAAAAEQVSVDQLNLIQETELAALREQQENLEELEEDLEELRLAIPDRALAEDFIDSLASAAIATGVDLVSVSLAEAGNWGVAPSTEGAPTTSTEGVAPPPAASAAPGVYTIAVNVQVTGQPLNILAFSKLAQEAKRLFFVENFTYDDAEDRGTLAGYIFVFRDTSLPPPAPSDGIADESDASGTETEPTPSPTPTPTPTETPAP